MPKTKQTTYWTPQRVERLRMWYRRYTTEDGSTYKAISKHFKGKTPNSVYKKLGRMGIVQAPWSKNCG